MNISDIRFGVTDWSGVPRTEHKGGRRITLAPGMSYQVSENGEPHRSYTTDAGAKLFVVD